jgi:uncharacterized protein (TIRG00374 family)
VLQIMAIVLVGVGVAAAIYLQHATISEGLRQFRHIRWRWVVVAGLSELVSMLGLALLYRDLLRANKTQLKVPWIMACCFKSNAIALSVPVIGSGIATRRTFRRFRQGGADATTASFALTVGGVVSTLTMATVIAAGAVLSGNPAAAFSGIAGAMVVLGMTVFVAIELHSDKGTERLLRFLRCTLRAAKRAIRRPKGDPDVIARTALVSLGRMRLGASTTGRILLWGLLNWWADVACLVFSLFAVGIDNVAIGKILLVWVAGTGAASLSPTPGGIGAVEVAMVAALAAFGVRGPDAILAVLVYRLTTFKVAGSLWAAVYEYADHHRRSRLQGVAVTHSA